MEILKNEHYSVTDYSIDTVPGMIIGLGDTKEEAIDNFLLRVKEVRKMCYKNIEILDSIIKESSK